MAMTLHTVDLADDPYLAGEQLQWEDEADWDPVAQEQERSLSGAMQISEGNKHHGRPITLASNDGAWFTFAKVQELVALRDQLGLVMLLTLPTGAVHWVTWNRVDGPALEYVQVQRRVDPAISYYTIRLRLITVAPPAP